MSWVWNWLIYFTAILAGNLLGNMLVRSIIRKMCIKIVAIELEKAFLSHLNIMHRPSRPGTIHLHDEGPFTI